MCPLAEILHSKGYNITGSDNNESDTLTRIRRLGIPVIMGQKAENVDGADMVVFTAALLPDNPELVSAKEKGIPTFERSKLFGAISRKYGNCIGISGTHGKTTATSMTTQILMQSDLDPSVLIGGKLPLINANGRVGSSDLFVCEACEFKDTFLDISPKCSVILNIDADHLDYFKTMDNLKASFTKFADMSDTVIYNGDDRNTLDAVNNIKEKESKNFISFGLKATNDWYAENIKEKNGAFPVFDIMHKGKIFAHIELSVPGDHNILNSLAAAATAVYAGADAEHCKKGLESFRGAGRRFEILYEKNGITIADDYAHHPKELAVTLDAALKMDYNRVWAVFQPFTFSRTYMLMNDFAGVLSKADKCLLTEIMGSREINEWGVTASQLQEKIPGSVLIGDFDKAAEYLSQNAESGDLIITLGCGDVYKIAKKLIKIYENN